MNAGLNFGQGKVAYGWRRGLAYVLLWTVAVATLENWVPLSSLSPELKTRLFLQGIPGWLLAAGAFVAMTAIAVPRLSALQLTVATIAVIALITLLRAVAPNPFVSLRVPWPPDLSSPTELALVANPVYLSWALCLYGGLFVCANALAHRAERKAALLSRAEIARGRSEALFSEAELAALQGSVDPAFLLRALDGLQRRYAAHAAGAERLLDHLVSFLRLAMPAVRSGQSTLGAELALARAYFQLAAELEAQHVAWRCDIDAALADLPFPPLLILPVLDQLAAAVAGRSPITLNVVAQASQVTLVLHGDVQPGWLAEDLRYRLGVGLRAIHSQARVAQANSADAPALTMTLPLEPFSSRADAAPSFHPQPGASPPWTFPPTPLSTLPATLKS